MFVRFRCELWMSTTMRWYFSKSCFGDDLGLKRGLDTSSFHIMMTIVHKEQTEQHIWRLFINGSSGFYGLITSQQSNRGQVGVGGQNDSGSPNKETQRPNGDKLDKLLLDKRFLDKIISHFKFETNSVVTSQTVETKVSFTCCSTEKCIFRIRFGDPNQK